MFFWLKSGKMMRIPTWIRKQCFFFEKWLFSPAYQVLRRGFQQADLHRPHQRVSRPAAEHVRGHRAPRLEGARPQEPGGESAGAPAHLPPAALVARRSAAAHSAASAGRRLPSRPPAVWQCGPVATGQGRVGNKKTHPKKPTKNVFLGFFKFFIFYENNTNFSLWNRFFFNKVWMHLKVFLKLKKP